MADLTTRLLVMTPVRPETHRSPLVPSSAAPVRWAAMMHVSMEDREEALSDVWLFHGATDEELTMLAERAYEVSVGPQVDIVTQHEFGDELFLVVDRRGGEPGRRRPRRGQRRRLLRRDGAARHRRRASSVRSIVAITLLALRARTSTRC